MKIKVTKVHPDAQLPSYATPGSACFDLYAVNSAYVVGSAVFATGLKFEIPEGWGMLIFSRSGHGFKKDTRLANCVGIIDSDYRGEVMVKLRQDGVFDALHAKAGDAVAQAMLVPIERIEFDLVEELSTTERGENGFGSTDNRSAAERLDLVQACFKKGDAGV